MAITVNNSGTMIGRNGSAVNIDTDGSVAEMVFVTNYGMMEGRSAELGRLDGDAIDVDGLVHVDNYGRIAGLGAEGYHNGEPNVSEAIAIGGGDIVNSADAARSTATAAAIQVDNSSNSNALGATTIVNDGLIQGDGHGPEGVSPADAARFDLRGNEAINLRRRLRRQPHQLPAPDHRRRVDGRRQRHAEQLRHHHGDRRFGDRHGRRRRLP